MKARSTMRIVKVFLVCVLMFGVAAVAGWGIAHTTLPGETWPQASATTLRSGSTTPAAAYTQTQNPYRQPTRPPVPAQAAKADSPQSQPTHDRSNSVPAVNSPGWQSTASSQPTPGWDSTASSQPTGTGQSGYSSVTPRTVIRYEPDPENPGQYKAVEEQVYPSIQPQQVLDETPQQIAVLMAELRHAPASPSNPEKLVKLRKLISEQFDKRHQSQVARLEKVQADVQRTQELLARRHEQRDEIIARRVTQLLGEQDPLQWDYQPAMPVYPASNPGYGTQYSLPTPSLPPVHAPNPYYSGQPSRPTPGLPSIPPLYASPQTAYPPVYRAPQSRPNVEPAANQDVPLQLYEEELRLNLPEKNVDGDWRAHLAEVLLPLVARIRKNRMILEKNVGRDKSVADFSQPNPSIVQAHLAQDETELKFYTDRLNSAAERKKLDLADAQKQYEVAHLQAEHAQKLYDKKEIDEFEWKYLQLKSGTAKNAVERAERELSDINQQLQLLESIQEKPSAQSPIPDAAPGDDPAPPSIDDAAPESTPPLETRM